MQIMGYDKLLEDMKNGRIESIDRKITQDAEYKALADEQKARWAGLLDMGLSDAALEAVAEYGDLCSRQASKYSELMYMMGVQDGIRLVRM